MKRILTVLTSIALVLPAIAADPQVPYPAGYSNWHHVKSMVIDKGHPLYEAFGGIHHLYANPKAVAGYKSGKFPDGAIIVFDLLEAKSADNAVSEGARKVVGVMHKDAKKFTATGGWGFEGVAGSSHWHSKPERPVTNAQQPFMLIGSGCVSGRRSAIYASA
jgi:hypothetical protein